MLSRPCFYFIAPLLFAVLCLAQEPRREVIVVTGTAEPLPLQEIDRYVAVLSVSQEAPLSNTLEDLLRLDPSIDLRRRAPNGLQGDLSMRGGTFGQTLVLLNGLRLNDAQTGHHNMDIPVPLEALSRIEVLHGSGSTLYGSDAVGGVVNLITEQSETSDVRLRTSLGSFGVNQQRVSLGGGVGRFRQRIVLSRDFSSGFRPGREFRNLSLFSETQMESSWGPSNLMLAGDDRRFGADQFYGDFNSWENTKTLFASLRQTFGEKTQAAFSFRRHSDWFVLRRDRPEDFQNHHVTRSHQLLLRRRESPSSNVSLHYGAEWFRDSIVSSNLGEHSRNRGAGYVLAEFRALRRFSFSVGAREELHQSLPAQFSPSMSAGVWLTRRLKLRGSINRAFRVPTYTDLYYRDPASVGRADLRPERSWNYEGGLDWHPGGTTQASLTVFHRREQDGIDYVRRSASDLWRATNIQDLRFSGLELALLLAPHRSHRLDFRYTGLRGAQAALQGLLSRYVFNYPSHAAVASWQASFAQNLLMRTRLGVTDRLGREPDLLWDLYAGWGRGRFRPFVQFTNLTGTRYEEIAGVPMPGRAVVGGIEIVALSGR